MTSPDLAPTRCRSPFVALASTRFGRDDRAGATCRVQPGAAAGQAEEAARIKVRCLQGPRAKMRVGAHLISCGGQATTMLATVAAMGLRGKYVGVIGNDDNGERIRRALTRLGLDVEHAIVRSVPNPHALILVDERTGGWNRPGTMRIIAR